MPKNNAVNSIQEAMDTVRHAGKIEARQQSYAVATEISKNVITRYGNWEAEKLVPYWSALADGFYAKILEDMKKITEG